MANAVYDLFKQELMKGASNNLLNSSDGATGVFVALVDTGTYTFSQSHQFYSDLSGVVGTDQEILSKTQTAGVFDGDNVTFSAVTGNDVEALVLYRKNSGADTTWPLIAFIDTNVTGLPVTPNGGDIGITWNASGIFKL
jgi:hypothetical protein